ncbi:hypothetical protein [Eggerthella lenta]|nr:hypothetical protein [Eggerthella lenta]
MKKKHKKRLRKLLFESIELQLEQARDSKGADSPDLSGIAGSARVLKTL